MVRDGIKKKLKAGMTAGVMEWWSDGWFNLTISPLLQHSSTPTLQHSVGFLAGKRLKLSLIKATGLSY
jgi:hypothetical protein